jgi:superfamily II DNA/RNA helicase
MPPEIRRLADAFLTEPKEITVAPPASPAATVTQGLAPVPGSDYAKREALRALIRAETVKNALIFCNRKRDVDTLYKSLKRHGFSVGSLHGDMDQSTRMETLDAFKRGDMTLLVCSDVAARGLDIDDLSHVFNFDVPIHAEDYVHRIGRTGRAGRSGRAFTLAAPDDRKFVDAIQRLIGKEIPRIAIEGVAALEPGAEEAPREHGRRGRRAHHKEGGRKSGSHGGGHKDVHHSDGGERHPRAHREHRGHREHQDQHAAVAPSQAAARAPSAPTPLPHHPLDDRRAHANGKAPRPEHPRQEPVRQHEPRAHEPRRHREERDEGPAQAGLGDHMPAFLMRGKRAIG